MKQQRCLLNMLAFLFLLVIVGVTSVVYARPITSQQILSSSWSTQNIGAVGRKGTFVASGDIYRVWGSGHDIGGKSDQFFYVYSSLSGDGELMAHVISQDATDNAAKAGLMLRETLAVNAPNVFLALTPHYGIALQWRGTPGGMTQHISGSQRKVPQWMKLVRQNNNVTGWTSYEGSHWIKVRSVTISMSATVSIGLAVTAHNETRLSQAVFAHVRFSKQPVSPTPTAIPSPTPTQTPISSPTLPTPTPLPPVLQRATQVYGQGGDFTTNELDVSATSLNTPNGITLDSSGNRYIADEGNNRVLYYPVGSTAATRVYGQGNSLSANVASTSATGLNAPFGVAVDNGSNLYIADEGNNRVLYYPAGSTTATRVYGQGGDFTTSVADVSATNLNSPTGVAVDSNGNLYVADSINNRVLYYPTGSTTATRVYGQGGNFTTNTVGASATGLNAPGEVTLDDSGNLYVADSGNNRVLYYPTGSTTATRVYGQGGDFTTSAVGASATGLNTPNRVMLDRNGNLYVADSGNNRVLYYPVGSTIAARVYGQGGDFTTSAVNKSGVNAAGLNVPDGVAVDGSGDLYIADGGNNRVLYYPVGSTTATQVYGQGGNFTTNASNVSSSSLNAPFGMILDSSGDLYVADSGNSRVLYYPVGSTVATRVYGQRNNLSTNLVNKGGVSANSLNIPNGVTLDSNGNLYIADSGNNRVLYYPVGSTTATRVYGQKGDFTTSTADVSAMGLDTPDGVTLDNNGNLYIADTGNDRVLYYPAGSTTATRVYGQKGDFTTNISNKGGASAASLSLPVGVVLDRNENLYISDTNNSRVLYYPAGSTTATRVYGQGGDFTTTIDTNKGGISPTSLVHPFEIALDSSDDLYVDDLGNSRVLYYPAGSTTATQVYGQGGNFTTNVVNNGGITATSLMYPIGIVLDNIGNLYVADGGDNRVLVFLHS